MYGKLFASMYDGTLATKGPWEALVTFQQMVILCDETGVLDITHEALSRRTTIPIEYIRKGIRALEKADPSSRTPTEGGRRIVRLSNDRTWGWRIVNYEYYRGIRTQEERRLYMRNYQRDRRKNEKKNRTKRPHATAVNNGKDLSTSVSDVNQSSKQYAVSINYSTTTAAIASLLPSQYQDTVREYLTRRARNPVALEYELKMLVNGGGERAETWETVGHALHDMAVADAAVTPRVLRAFCRRLRETPSEPTNASGPESFAEILSRVEREESSKAGGTS